MTEATSPSDGAPVALVTGGARGLGRDIAAAFMAAGYRVVTCGRHRPESGPGAAPEAVPGPVSDPGPQPDMTGFLVCDVRDPDQVAAMLAVVRERFGRLDVLVNNAGGMPYADAAGMSPRLFERIVALNLLAPFYVAQQANRIMQSQEGGGVIINVGSTAATRPAPGAAPYAAAKAGLTTLTRALALEWAPKVRVVQVTPGLMRTELVAETYGRRPDAVAATVPAGRFGTGADVAAACLALSSADLGYVTGSELVVDGGGETPAWVLAFDAGPGSEG